MLSDHEDDGFETAGSLISHKKEGDNGGEITVIFKAEFGTVSIELKAEGAEYSLAENMPSTALMEEDSKGYYSWDRAF